MPRVKAIRKIAYIAEPCEYTGSLFEAVFFRIDN